MSLMNRQLKEALSNILSLPEEFHGEQYGKHIVAVDKTADFVRHNFKIIIDQLRKMKPSQLDDTTRESLQFAILKMGEMDRMTPLFKTVKELEELKGIYRKFSLQKVRRLTSARIEEAWEKEGPKDIESEVKRVKQDNDYELFYLTKEDGSAYFSQALARSMPLSSHALIEEFTGEDPFLQVKGLLDRRFQMLAEEMVKKLGSQMQIFFEKYKANGNHSLSKALLALMMAANPQNLLRHLPAKSCYYYFADFHHYLREFLASNEESELAENLAAFAFHTPFLSKETNNVLFRLLGPVLKEKELPQFLSAAFRTLKHLFHKFPEGPLFKGFDLLIDKTHPAFDPFLLDNWPYTLWDNVVHLPSPTIQETIQRAKVTEEFKCFLNTLQGRHLLVNLQDRTSWKEHARSTVLEELQNLAEFHEKLTVITLAKDTDFYHQDAFYYNLNLAEDFINQFKEHLTSKECGFYFPKEIQDKLFPIDSLLHDIHKKHFSSKNVLSRRERLDFIELAYLLIIDKIATLSHAKTISFTCKDGIDVGSAQEAAYFAFKHPHFTDKEKETYIFTLFAPSFLLRERLIQEERMSRLLLLLKHLLSTAIPK